MQDSQDNFSNSRNGKAYIALASVLKHKGDKVVHKTIHAKALEMITEELADTLNPGELAVVIVNNQ